MNRNENEQRSPGSISGGVGAVERRTDLAVPQLASELFAAVQELGDLRGSEHVVRLLGTLVANLEARLDTPGNRFARTKTGHAARMLLAHPDMSLERVRGGTFVDFGCGAVSPLSSLVVLKALGAARCIGIDLDALAETIAVRAMARTALELMGEPTLYFPSRRLDREYVQANLRGLDIRACLEGEHKGMLAALGSFPVEYRRARAENTGLDDASVDGVTSFSFLEHVPDPDAVIAEMARVCKPGAVGRHTIDGADHRSYSNPKIGRLQFLYESSGEPILYGCNRIRPLDFVPIFERHGFEVVEHSATRSESVSAKDRSRMAEPYRSMPMATLSTLGAQVSLRRR